MRTTTAFLISFVAAAAAHDDLLGLLQGGSTCVACHPDSLGYECRAINSDACYGRMSDGNCPPGTEGLHALPEATGSYVDSCTCKTNSATCSLDCECYTCGNKSVKQQSLALNGLPSCLNDLTNCDGNLHCGGACPDDQKCSRRALLLGDAYPSCAGCDPTSKGFECMAINSNACFMKENGACPSDTFEVAPHPFGSFSDTCNCDARTSGTTCSLSCQCEQCDGKDTKATNLDLLTCDSFVTNCGGKLFCGESCPPDTCGAHRLLLDGASNQTATVSNLRRRLSQLRA